MLITYKILKYLNYLTHRALGLIVSLSLILALSACSITPGNSAFGLRMAQQSTVAVPASQKEESVPENIEVKQITAQIIIDQLKKNQAQFRAGAAGGQTARQVGNTPTFGIQHTDYKIGPGDIINVTVWDHPELTIPAGSFRSAEASGTLIAEDGSIFYPYVGTIKVENLTVHDLRELLVKRLSKYIEKVQLDVRVVSFRSKRIYIVGEVKNPGLQPIDDIPMTILEAVSRAGGFTLEADHGNVLLTRGGVTYRVDVQALYEDGDVTQNIPLVSGDIINVPDRQINKIFVLGEVTNPGSYLMNKRRTSLAEALSDAGFINQNTAAPGWIYVMRSGEGKPELFHLNAHSPDALLLAERFPLMPRDVVYVDVANVARWNRVVSNILPTTTLLNSIQSLRYPLFSGRP